MARRDKGTHIVLSAVEHQSILQAAKSLERFGFCTTLVPVDKHGVVDPEEVKKAVRKETALVSVILASSEVGTIEPLARSAAFAGPPECLSTLTPWPPSGTCPWTSGSSEWTR